MEATCEDTIEQFRKARVLDDVWSRNAAEINKRTASCFVKAAKDEQRLAYEGGRVAQ